MAAFATTLILFLLAIAAFVAGMELHHRKYTSAGGAAGRSLVLELLGLGRKTPEPAAAPDLAPENPAPAGTE
jgi:hypothetical protein